jgi:hypothetical protein
VCSRVWSGSKESMDANSVDGVGVGEGDGGDGDDRNLFLKR